MLLSLCLKSVLVLYTEILVGEEEIQEWKNVGYHWI